ncbi:MAG TPA: ABC transporter substrate-binding protein [Ideonella sp.]|nr:ABC transporter substrate-binding protein [Ideonella sp.]
MRSLSRRRWLQAAAATGIAPAAALWAAAPQRIVCIGGALTETVYALGAQGLLVGVDTTSLYPAAARALPSVGYARALSAEGVLSLAPTLIVASDEAGPPAVLRQLEAAKVPLKRLPLDHRFEGLVARTSELAALLDRAEAGKALSTQLQREWQATTAQVATLAAKARPPRVLFVLSHSMSQIRVAGADTAADSMIRLAGGANALTGFDGYKPLNAEAAIAAAPDFILATDQGLEAAGGAAGLLKAPGLAMTPAGRAQRVVSLEALWLLGFGPRLPSAVAALAQGLHTGVSVAKAA